jgi:RNA polymerase sigma factor (sigma-70 family)
VARFTGAPKEECEDLVHNIYESCLRYKHAYVENKFSFVTYILAVARKVIATYFNLGRNYWGATGRSYWKHYGKGWSYDKLLVYDEDISIPPDQLEMLQEKQMKRKLSKFLASLPVRQRQVAILVMRDEAYEYIQETLGISESSVTSNWQIVINKGKDWAYAHNLCWRYCFTQKHLS